MRLVMALVLSASITPAASAACPQELAVYASGDKQSGIEFVAGTQAMAMSHEVRINLADHLVLAGYVGSTAEPEQTYLLVPYQCPEGDVTGEELDACIVYQSVIYAVGDKGDVGDLPSRGNAAAAHILLPGLLQSLTASRERLGAAAIASAAEFFSLTGCQE